MASPALRRAAVRLFPSSLETSQRWLLRQGPLSVSCHKCFPQEGRVLLLSHRLNVGHTGFMTRTIATAATGPPPQRPQSKRTRELPIIPDRRPIFAAAALVVVTIWTAFASYATNKERLSSSVFRSVLTQIKDSDNVNEALGSPVLLEPSILGDPWVAGSVNMMQGKVDISFRVKGPRSSGTVYFTSIRRNQMRTFEVLRFLVVTDRDETISMLDEDRTNASMTHDSDGDMTFV
ncbi:DUF1783-domain-containing protein [Tilletiaria anomala UBC 951]|uniref:DUF1783-domain-containing protein n=1 Tax=Tilletiaria anomala (strain ATCC 24038 / CBS 436.72 / UBC 951) TaxID=1037660 RepID=A0A066WAT8_TILAU|nr:DUF1783-domain-containing protein [Tilletiaria anomala UBC 951]KDN48204.1 DUF1783-domain-containing protein [Tilletiaria anomala UBC 951]